jgi:hypothetical protein
LSATELAGEVKKRLPNAGQNEIWDVIRDNGLKDNQDYSAYNFRNKKHEDDYAKTGKLPSVTPSIYNYSANGSPSQYVAYVKFAWQPSRHQTLLLSADWPVARVLQLEEFEGKKYTHYVTYTVTLTFQITPDEDRSYGPGKIEVRSKLAPRKGIGLPVYIGRRAGKAVATERDARQMSFGDENVTPMKAGGPTSA